MMRLPAREVMSSHVVEAMSYEGLVTFVVPRQPQK
jgi:hypothetical protein